MGTLRIGIDTAPPEGVTAEFRHYEFTWEGNAEQAQASMRLFEDGAAGLTDEPLHLARSLLHSLYALLEKFDDLNVEQKAAILWYVLRMPTAPDGARSLLERITDEDFRVEIDARHHGGAAGEIKTKIEQATAH
jgi:hypothetical protein